MAEIPPIYVKLEADVSDLKKGLSDAQTAIKNLDDNVKKTGGAFEGFTTRLKQVGAALGVTFAASQVVGFFKESIAAATEAEAVQTRLATILRNTGGATEEQIAALKKQAEALDKVGVVTKENITMTQSQLATFDLQGKTIKTLTPAILDYVTAEKGASASTDDFRSMTNGLAQALNGNFASLTKQGFVLTENQKKLLSTGTESERAAALTAVLSSTYEGFNKVLAQTPEGRMIMLKKEFGDLKEEIGRGLLPVFEKVMQLLTKTVIPALREMIKFVKNNSSEIKTFAIVLGIGATAWGVYTAAQKLATFSMAKFNEVLKKNAFGIIVTTIALVAAGLVKLWNNSERFRTVVISVAKAAINAFASIIPMVAQVFEAIMRVQSGPLRTLLLALSKLPGIGKYAKAGLDAINKGLDGISDFGDKAAKKANELSAGLDKIAKSADKTKDGLDKVKKSQKDVWAGSKDPKGEMSKEDKKKLDKIEDLKAKAADLLEDWREVENQAAEDMKDAALARDEKIAEAKERYLERVAELNERYNEQMAEADERFAEAEANAKDKRRKAEEAARKKHAQAILDINAEYGKREKELLKQLTDKRADLERAAELKSQEIAKNGAEKLRAIIEKSRERLRDAWSSGTSFSLKDLFGTAKEKELSVVDAFKTQLRDTKDLQEGAGELAGQGFSQTFIEQIVKAGPAAGLEMMKQIKELSPEQQKELRSLYGELERLNEDGLNTLANALSDSTSFATTELRDMYAETQKEIAASLAQVQADLTANLAEATKNYDEAMTEAARIRDEKLAEADKALLDALDEAQKDFDEALAEANKALAKAQEEAKKQLDKGLLEAQKALNKAIEDAMNAFDKAIDKINESMTAKLTALQSKIAAISASLTALGSTPIVIPKISQISPVEVFTPEVYGGGVAVTTSTDIEAIAEKFETTAEQLVEAAANAAVNAVGGVGNVTVNGVNLTDPEGTASAIASIVKYGQTVQVHTTQLSGIEMTGINAYKAGFRRVAV